MTEFELIRRYFTHRPRRAVLGVGDDAAIVRVPANHELLVSADMLVEGRHFFRGADPRALGHKSLAVNLSDMAAMGATPRWATLGLALPRANARWLSAFARGFMDLARRHDVDLVGGDTTRGPLNICVQIMGVCRRGKALRRDGARVGDDIWVSGTLGDAALALAALNGKVHLSRPELACCELRLHRPQPRVALGSALLGVAHSAIDISDGLLADLGHILERSGVAAEIELSRLPVSGVMKRHAKLAVARQALLSGGDDYELCFTAAPSLHARVAATGRRLKLELRRIGSIRRMRRGCARLAIRAPGGGVVSLGNNLGHDHFA